MNRNRRNSRHMVMILIMLLLTVSVMGCGKKGDPTLKSYEKPPVPSNLSVVHREDAMLLSWAYPASKENLIAQFIVLRSTGPAFEKISHIEKEKRGYIDRDIKNGVTYEYKVISQNFRGVYSDDSNSVYAAPAAVPAAPAKLSYAVSGDSVTLSWQPAGNKVMYNVYRSAKKGEYAMKPLNTEPLTTPSFRDTFSVNNIFHYTIRSLTGGSIRNEGPASDELTVDSADLIPPVVTGLQAFAAPDRVILSWSEVPEPWVIGFRVYRKKAGGEYVLLGKTETPTFLDPEAASSARDYLVTAAGKVKEGPPSEIRNVKYIPQE